MSPVIPCVVCGGENKLGCPGCNGSGVNTVSGELPEGAPGFLARKACGCAVDWVGDGISADHLAQRRALWAKLGLTVEEAGWTPETVLALTEGAACSHVPGATPTPAPVERPPIRITRVELSHCPENADHFVTHAMLHIKLDDGTWRMVEVVLPTHDFVSPDTQPEGP